MELGVIHHGPNLPALCTSREGRLRWVTAASKDAVPVVEVHQIARALLTALVAGVQSLTISMPNVRTIPSQSHLIFLPLDPIGVLFPTQSIATMKVKEAGRLPQDDPSSLQSSSTECFGDAAPVSPPLPLQAI